MPQRLSSPAGLTHGAAQTTMTRAESLIAASLNTPNATRKVSPRIAAAFKVSQNSTPEICNRAAGLLALAEARSVLFQNLQQSPFTVLVIRTRLTLFYLTWSTS